MRRAELDAKRCGDGDTCMLVTIVRTERAIGRKPQTGPGSETQKFSSFTLLIVPESPRAEAGV